MEFCLFFIKGELILSLLSTVIYKMLGSCSIFVSNTFPFHFLFRLFLTHLYDTVNNNHKHVISFKDFYSVESVFTAVTLLHNVFNPP